MQSRAIVLSMGMLLQKVSFDAFQQFLMRQAKVKLDAEKVGEALAIVNNFNLDQPVKLSTSSTESKSEAKEKEEQTVEHIESEFEKEFREKLYKCLAITAEVLSPKQFWAEWDKSIEIGNLAESIQALCDLSAKHNFKVYLISETNIHDLQRIQREAKSINLNLSVEPYKLGSFPLYATCQMHRKRDALSAEVFKGIRQASTPYFKTKEPVPPIQITMLLSDPDGIQDGARKAIASKTNASIIDLCGKMDVAVLLQRSTQTFEETLKTLLDPKPEYVASATL